MLHPHLPVAGAAQVIGVLPHFPLPPQLARHGPVAKKVHSALRHTPLTQRCVFTVQAGIRTYYKSAPYLSRTDEVGMPGEQDDEGEGRGGRQGKHNDEPAHVLRASLAHAHAAPRGACSVAGAQTQVQDEQNEVTVVEVAYAIIDPARSTCPM